MPDQVLQDPPTVTTDGERVRKLPNGVTFHEVKTQFDERGSLCEMFDPRWGWHKDSLLYAYFITIRPGFIKGWAMHKLHEDRYFIQFGDMEVILYDARPESPTYELVSTVVLSEYRRRLMNIPAGIWHADRNIGTKDVVLANFPTIPYNHENPDKYRLPLNTEKIPYKFDNPKGW